jgi:hypothetical protein
MLCQCDVVHSMRVYAAVQMLVKFADVCTRLSLMNK